MDGRVRERLCSGKSTVFVFECLIQRRNTDDNVCTMRAKGLKLNLR